MARGKALSSNERRNITQKLAQGFTPAQIGKLLKRDARTIKKAIIDINYKWEPCYTKGTSMLSDRDMRKIKIIVRKHPLWSSKAIFDKAGLPQIKKNTRCRALKKIAILTKPEIKPPLSQINEIKRVNWGRKYMKLDFSNVIFTDECRATLDGPDGWRRGWVTDKRSVPGLMRRQQGGGGVMFWAAIVGDRFVGPFNVVGGVKVNSEMYSKFLDTNFFPWYAAQSRTFKRKCMFMHDNAPCHASRFTTAYLMKKRIIGDKIMTWPPQFPDLNPIENLWSIVKRRLYPGDKQYKSKAELWEAIQSVCATIKPDEILTLTTSMDNRLFKVVNNNGKYIKM